MRRNVRVRALGVSRTFGARWRCTCARDNEKGAVLYTPHKRRAHRGEETGGALRGRGERTSVWISASDDTKRRPVRLDYETFQVDHRGHANNNSSHDPRTAFGRHDSALHIIFGPPAVTPPPTHCVRKVYFVYRCRCPLCKKRQNEVVSKCIGENSRHVVRYGFDLWVCETRGGC